MDVKKILNYSNYLNNTKNVTINTNNNIDNNLIEANANNDSIQSSTISKGNEEQDNKNDNSRDSNSKELDKAIDTLNKFLEKEQTHAEYSVYKPLGRTVVKIVDDKTDKVIMEFPQEKILDMVTSMLQNAGLLDKKA